MANFTVPISANELQTLLDKNLQQLPLVNNLLHRLDETEGSIAKSLLAIFKDELIADGSGGMIEVNNLKVLSVESMNRQAGKILLTYSVNRFFACDGIENDMVKKETLNFNIDEEKMLMTITLFELPKF